MSVQNIICICSIALIFVILSNITYYLVNGHGLDIKLLLKTGLAGCACIVIWHVDPTYLRIAGRAAAASIILQTGFVMLEDYKGDEPGARARKNRVLMLLIGMVLLFLSCQN